MDTISKLYQIIFFILLSIGILTKGHAFQEGNKSNKELINFMVGGTWVSENEKNSGTPEDFESFYMNFENWHDENSVRGSIYGVKNNGETVGLIEVWNFIDPSNKSIRLIQRTIWQEHSEGTIHPYNKNGLDITFKSTTSDGQVYYTRDIHHRESLNKLRAESFHRTTENEEWKKANESVWTRVKKRTMPPKPSQK